MYELEERGEDDHVSQRENIPGFHVSGVRATEPHDRKVIGFHLLAVKYELRYHPAGSTTRGGKANDKYNDLLCIGNPKAGIDRGAGMKK